MNKCVKLFISFCVMLSLSQAIFAATYTVTKVADTNDGACNADCSLREAIAAANATADNDEIAFSSETFSMMRTLVLSGTDLIIANNGTLSINGTGINSLTINGNNASRIFTNSAGAVTEIKNMRLTRGNGVSSVSTGFGGAIRNNGGTLTLNNLVVTENTAAASGGGLSNGAGGTTNVNFTTISDNTATDSGGGVQNSSGNNSVLNLLNSTISSNKSDSAMLGGGGILAGGVVFISNMTISGNTTAGSGGAVYYNGQNLTMNNATVANNRATNQTGGFHTAGAANAASFRNSLFAGNTGGGSPDVSGIINSLGNNLIQAPGTSTGWTASDILNEFAQLGSLNNNGGPTQTHALELDSPAINAGNNCVVNLSCPTNNPPVALTTDQRGPGFPRLSRRLVDIGAYEVSAPLVVRDAPFDFDGDGRTDFGTFRPADARWLLSRSSSGLLTAQFGREGDRITPADFDGDNITDIAIWRSGELAYFYIVNSSSNTVRIEQFGKTGDDPRVVGDWDGDGRADPAVYRNAEQLGEQSFFFYRPSAQPGVDFIPIRWGTARDEALRGDFDGDNRLDAAVYRALDNIWYILRSSDEQPFYVKWGAPSDIRVEGDFDGDGKTDIVVFRDGLWAILLSSNSQPLYQIWGAAGDTPVPGDYDGDGRTDFAYWRNGVFSVLPSGGGMAITLQLGETGDLPIPGAFVRGAQNPASSEPQ